MTDRKNLSMQGQIARLREQVRILREPALEFVRKVDAGEARSVRSYNAFKDALGQTED